MHSESNLHTRLLIRRESLDQSSNATWSQNDKLEREIKKSTAIRCDLHDQLEVACLYRYTVEVATSDGNLLSGTATTTRTDADKSEHLVLTAAGKLQDVPMHEIVHVRVTTPGARFAEIVFP